MSRWWPERIRIALHPDRAALVRFGGRRRRTIVGTQVVRFEGSRQEPAQVGAAIGGVLNLPEWRHAAVEIVLSHALCKLALIPGGIAVRGRVEEAALSRSCIEDANGELPAGWRIAVAEAAAHQTRLACAADGALIDAIERAARSSGGKIASLHPLLVDAYNVRRAAIGSGRLWFATVERERCCIARFHDGAWESLRIRRVFDDPEAELASLLRQERVLAGNEAAPDGLLLCAPNHPHLRLPAGIAPVRLNAPDAGEGLAAEAADFGMALEGLG